MGQVFEKFVQPDEVLLDGILSMHCSWLTTGCVDDDYITSGALHFACEYSSIMNTRPRQLIMDPFLLRREHTFFFRSFHLVSQK